MRREEVKLVLNDWENLGGKELVHLLEYRKRTFDRVGPVALRGRSCSDEKYFLYSIYKNEKLIESFTNATDLQSNYTYSKMPIYALWNPPAEFWKGDILADKRCCNYHPATFYKLTHDIYLAMRNSSSMFGRKFMEESGVWNVDETSGKRFLASIDDVLVTEMLDPQNVITE